MLEKTLENPLDCKEIQPVHPKGSDPMNCSPPGSSIHGIFPARVLEWGAIAFSIFQPMTLKHPGGEVGDESWSQASGPREQWLSPGKRSRGFWPMVLVNWMCPSVYVPTSRMRCPHLPTWGGCKTSVCRGRGVWRPGGNTWNCLIRVPPGRTDRKASLELFLN